jgi:formimidoylglutamate deiminase
MSLQSHYRFETAWLPEGWRRDVHIAVDEAGDIAAVTPDDSSSDAVSVPGAALPGMPNVHSHAFQRAMVGLAERRSTRSDSFWSWRETLYDLARRMTPESLNAIAAQLYVEMLKAGYTAVCEFHYLHNQPDGRPYAERGIMSQAVMDAASASGIGLTLLPALYMTSDFNDAPPTPRQRQFVLDVDEFMRLTDGLRSSSRVDVGMAFHSLRAVPPRALASVLDALASRQRCAIHIHVAEQEREVAASLHSLQQRPVEWLMQNAPVDSRWCLVHATHATPAELSAVARSQAVVALCPTTEANLGDGLFALQPYLESRGSLAIGSDSHISVSPCEELRWLEYQARLHKRERNVIASDAVSTGATLWQLACAGGAKATGRAVGALEVGRRADIVVLDLESPLLAGRSGDEILDTHVFAGQAGAIRDVMAGGRWVVQDGHHFAETPIAAGFRRAMAQLAGGA